jgi:hypothetical protein
MGAQAVLAAVQIGTTLYQGVQAKKASDKAARAAQRAGEFNAGIIERDIDLFERQRGILNAQFAIDQKRARDVFERDVQGKLRASTGFAGFDMSVGTPLNVLRQNAREFDYQLSVNEFNNEIANMQISDAQEEARLNAELSRMEGGMAAASARAQGTASLISSAGKAARTAYETGFFDKTGAA